MHISKECDALLCVLYREYLVRRSHCVSIDQASYFRDDVSIRENFMPLWSVDDVCTLCWRLVDHGLLFATLGDDRANDVSLTEQGLTYMQNRFGTRLDEVLSRLEKLFSLVLPWVCSPHP